MMENRPPALAVVGASGAVGAQIVELIGERGFEYRELKPFASDTGSAEVLSGADSDLIVDSLASPSDLSAFDIAFLCVPENVAAEIIAARPGPLLIDLSAAAHAPAGVPLVAPGLVSREKLIALAASGVVAPAHPAAQVIAICLSALGIRGGAVSASLMSGASAGGRAQITKLVEETTDLLNARLDLEDEGVQRGFNAFVREHERSIASAIRAQARLLLDEPPAIALSVATIPIIHGSALSIDIPLRDGADLWIEKLRAAPGLLLEEESAAVGVIDAVGQEAIIVAADLSDTSLALWCVFDNARLAALSALWVAETVAPGARALT